MRLRNVEGHGVDLWVAGYQFPDADNPGQRFSWHLVAGNASTAEGAWRFEYAALTCDETPRVSSWLRQVHRGETPGPLQFTEPNLEFSVADSTEDEVDLRVALDLEFLPPWVRHSHAGDPTVIRIGTTPAEIARAADDWDEVAARFPDGT